MEKRELRRRMAPCGLLCYTCAGAKDGVIRSHSKALLHLLESFDAFAERFSAFEPKMNRYPDFKEVLTLFSEAGCGGCRGGRPIHPDCRVSPCVKEKGYDFCFECDEFPCDEVGFDQSLREKWLSSNNRMKEIGAQAYFEEAKNRPHYS